MPHPQIPSAPHVARLGARARRVAGATLVAIALLAGCAAPDPATTEPSTDADGPEAAALAFSQCMRDNGIADFPDPTVEDGEVLLPGLDELDVSDEVLSSARTVCQPILDEGRAAVVPEGGTAASDWLELVAGGETACADGSEYRFYVRSADPARVVLYLDGGGACWTAETCSGEVGQYQTTVEPPNDEGLLDTAEPANPLADFSVVYAPYCTGDVHLGDAVTTYGDGPTISHRGYPNGLAALEHLVATFPDATQVVVVGGSAGSIASPVYATLVADHLPDASVTVVADASGAYPDAPELTSVLTSDAWGAGRALADWAAITGADASEWSFPGMVAASAAHAPAMRFARVDHADDAVQTLFLELAGVAGPDLPGLLAQTEAQIEGTGVDVASYVIPGDDHVILDSDDLYDVTVDGTALVDWVTAVVGREQVPDVH